MSDESTYIFRDYEIPEVFSFTRKFLEEIIFLASPYRAKDKKMERLCSLLEKLLEVEDKEC